MLAVGQAALPRLSWVHKAQQGSSVLGATALLGDAGEAFKMFCEGKFITGRTGGEGPPLPQPSPVTPQGCPLCWHRGGALSDPVLLSLPAEGPRRSCPCLPRLNSLLIMCREEGRGEFPVPKRHFQQECSCRLGLHRVPGGVSCKTRLQTNRAF